MPVIVIQDDKDFLLYGTCRRVAAMKRLKMECKYIEVKGGAMLMWPTGIFPVFNTYTRKTRKKTVLVASHSTISGHTRCGCSVLDGERDHRYQPRRNSYHRIFFTILGDSVGVTGHGCFSLKRQLSLFLLGNTLHRRPPTGI